MCASVSVSVFAESLCAQNKSLTTGVCVCVCVPQVNVLVSCLLVDVAIKEKKTVKKPIALIAPIDRNSGYICR